MMSVVRCLTFFMESAAWNQQQGPFDIFDRRADFDSCGTCSVLAARVACSARGSPRDTALRLKPKMERLDLYAVNLVSCPIMVATSPPQNGLLVHGQRESCRVSKAGI
jgi:hypothetical protein